MNSTFQPDSHPDAESLNAFAEQELPEREHSQVLAHLAACSRCRQVVFLAREAASEFAMQEAAASRPELDPAAAYECAVAMAAAPEPMAAVVAASGRGAGKRQRWWLGGWRLAWVPVAALASIVGLVVFVHGRQARLRETTGNESRLVVPQSPSQPQPKAAEHAPAYKTAMEKAEPAAPSIAAQVPAERVLTASASAPSEAYLAQAPPPSQALPSAGAMDMSTAELNRARSLPQPQGQGAGMQSNNPALQPQAAPAAAASRPEPAAGVNSFTDTSAGTPFATAHGAAGRVSASAMAPRPAMKAASMGSFISNQKLPVSNAAVLTARKAKITPLPSGLRAVSTVTAEHRTLAIDSSGTLFLSEDSGSKWEPVARQWSGRAAAVRMQAGLKINGTERAEAAVAQRELNRSNPYAAPPALFEIVNDSGLVWVSADGKTWKAQ